ncbi:Trap [Cotton chlorotic spot virus]|uniref:Transcriptional activator protein n=1 Tax=Cotton chlorotic spot virus TaxID=1396815 RepID=T2AZ83_9GEMI|nr:Trap [Cotton chlorotic spot virus]AGV02077.1 Trap [Cotton chlorotic spot virus]
MLNSSSSTPPSIKIRHRQAKRRAIRRKRVDLACGCSFFIHLNCEGHGFTHRGIHHATSSGEWRVYLGSAKSPLFQDNQGGRPTVHQHQNLSRQHPVQSQPEESIGSPQGVPELPSLDEINDSFWDDIFS